MPKVTMTRQISGTRNGQRWPAPGESLDVTADEAATLAAIGAIDGTEDTRGNTRTAEPAPAKPRKKTAAKKADS